MECNHLNEDVEPAIRSFPETFKTELAAIQAGARNGGVIPPRRNSGLLIEFERAKKKYDAKIATLRGHGPSRALDEVERAIENIAAEFAAELSAA